MYSCNTNTNYDTLSIFFDGVPKPDSNSVVLHDTINLASKSEKIDSTPKETIHPPFAEKKCKDCHIMGTNLKLVKKTPDLCLDCHNKLKDSIKFFHGPFITGYCNKCHDPHASPNQKLLLKNTKDLCFECHNKNDVLSNFVHFDLEKNVCWECHNPHGSKFKYMLKNDE